MADGWIKLHRKLKDSACFQNEKLLKVWIWCLLKASHAGRKQMVGRQETDILPGQFPTGRIKAASELNMKPSTAWEYLLLLQKQGNIDIKSNNKFSVVTVVNWGTYQFEEGESRQQNQQQIDSKSTANQQQINTNKNDKNVKNDKKINTSSKVFSDDSLEIQLAYEFLSLIKINNSNFKNPNVQKWASDFDKITRLDKRSLEDVRSVMTWAQRDNFWKSNVLSPSKLREKFDTLYIQMNSRGARMDKPKTQKPNRQFDAIDQWCQMTEGLIE